MLLFRCRIAPAWRTGLSLATLSPWSAADLLVPPPLRAQPITSARPTVVRTVPPQAKPNPALEAALREVLFPVRIDDGQGHGPDPGSAEAERAKRFQIKAACERQQPLRYIWDRVDLNDDGRPEVVAQVVGPLVCGTGGCTLLIVSERYHNGWKELISPVRVDAGTRYHARLPFEDGRYPANPSVPPGQSPGTPGTWHRPAGVERGRPSDPRAALWLGSMKVDSPAGWRGENPAQPRQMVPR